MLAPFRRVLIFANEQERADLVGKKDLQALYKTWYVDETYDNALQCYGDGDLALSIKKNHIQKYWNSKFFSGIYPTQYTMLTVEEAKYMIDKLTNKIYQNKDYDLALKYFGINKTEALKKKWVDEYWKLKGCNSKILNN